MFNKRWCIYLCFLFNSGCFLTGPTYHRPSVPVPTKWSAVKNVTIKDNSNLPHLKWWRDFQSEELNTLIQKALVSNNQLNQALANIEYAHSELNQVKLDWLPSMSLFGGLSQFPMYGNPGTFLVAFPVYALNVIQQYYQQKSAQAMFEASVYAKDSARLTVISQVAASFFTLIAQKEAIILYKKLIHDYAIYVNLVKSQYRHGLTSEDTIEQLNSQIKQIQSLMDITKHNTIVSTNALRYLLNENPGNIRVKTSFPSIDTNKVIPANLPTQVLQNRPDIRQAEATLKAANAHVGAISATLLPSVSLGGYLGYAQRFKNPTILGQAFLSGPVIDLPIFAAIHAGKAQYKALCIQYVDTIRQALRDVDNDLSAYSAYSNQLSHNSEAFEDERRRCRLVSARFRNGLSSQLDVMKCQIKLDQFALVINQYKLTKMLTIVTLYQDLAGGYRA